MADDIMPEEAARRRRLGEARRQAMRYPVVSENVDAAIERQRAAARDMVNREARRLPVPSGGREVVPYGGREVVPAAGREVVPASGGGGRGVVPPGGREVIPSPGDRMPITTGEAETGRSLSTRRAIPINPQMPNQAGRMLGRRLLGPAGVVLDATDASPVADATLRGNPEAGIQPYGGTRFNDEPVRGELPPTVVTAEADREIASRNQRRNTQRPATRMSPRQREMTADELNDIALGVYTRGSGATSEPGQQGDIARRIAEASGMKKGGKVKKMAKGGLVKASSSAGRRGDGIASRGKTRGRMV